MTSKKAHCTLGLMVASEYQHGVGMDESAVFDTIKNSHSKSVFLNAFDKVVEKALDLDQSGLLRSALNYAADGEAIIGADAVSRIEAVYQDFLSQYKPVPANKAKFLKDFAPKIERIKNDTMSAAQQSGQVQKLHIMNQYFKHQIEGGSIYGKTAHLNPVAKMARNAVSNLVKWNPMIAMMNGFEITPKAMAYTTAKGKPQALLQGISAFARDGGFKAERLSHLEAKGVYGTNPVETGLAAKLNPLDRSENLLRGLSYYIGEAVEPGLGLEAVEKIAFVHRYGNEPMIYLDHQGTTSMALMRYTLTATKFYGQMLRGIMNGDAKAAAAFAAFTAMTALQTGIRSAIPAPVDGALQAALGDDYTEALAAVDESTPINVAQKTLGTDLTRYAQPVGGLAFGAGYNVATQDVAGVARGTGKAIENAAEGNYGAAAVNFAQGIMSGLQVFNVPGVNLTTKRLVDTFAEVVDGEVDATPQDFGAEFLDKTNVYNPPQE